MCDEKQCGRVCRTLLYFQASLRNDSLLQSSIRIQNDTQKETPNNMSTKGLSPQNSLRSRSNTCSSVQQVSFKSQRMTILLIPKVYKCYLKKRVTLLRFPNCMHLISKLFLFRWLGDGGFRWHGRPLWHVITRWVRRATFATRNNNKCRKTTVPHFRENVWNQHHWIT